MDKNEFASKLKALSEQVDSFEGQLNTEEATKNALIMPFFANLGYNVFNPTEFVPEFTADFGSKKGERVDYAIVINDEVQILVETKELSDNLEKKDSQLFRYFTATKAKFGILTNGDTYKFYTDLEEPNVMDSTPFLTIKISDLKNSQISELFKFTKENFDIENITDSASDLKYVGLAKDYFTSEMVEPDEEFVRLVLSHIYDGIKTQQVVEQFKPVIAKGLNQIISEQVNSKLNNALNQTTSDSTENEQDTLTNSTAKEENAIVTTPEELESYAIVKLILKDVLDTNRIVYRDNRSYFNVLIDDNNRKWVLRVFFKTNRNYILLNDDDSTEINFESPIDIYDSADKIRTIAEQFK
ncbi:prophage protein [Secundilactobacillus pentosiphilus]|uniref:Prophage protein n=1 Tax=Secundilactobacillus pentosiphilus TaxID=1714682 RepID=A0A1Z5IYX9_9LACO|nr:type I restriction endonuclease [Secundilactobacillus pentosiphilus]GAX06846.1 prophage protein [Secundilactobacillus pentosiphilus]